MENKINNQEILDSAKSIMNNFMKELEKAESVEESFGNIRNKNKREMSDANKSNPDFVKRFFENAPLKNYNFILVNETKKEE